MLATVVGTEDLNKARELSGTEALHSSVFRYSLEYVGVLYQFIVCHCYSFTTMFLYQSYFVKEINYLLEKILNFRNT